MDHRIQIYFRVKGKPVCAGEELKTENYDSRKELKEKIWEMVDEYLNYMEERENEDDNTDTQ